MTSAQLEPYLVIRNRTMMFEQCVMNFCGVQEIPTFDHPHPVPPEKPVPGSLGHACGAKKIGKCRSWLQARAPKRDELQMVVTDEHLTAMLCRVCKE